MTINAKENWTGERVVPGVEGLEGLFQTHLVRYSFATQLFPQARYVLDLGCGTGYGSYYLAQQLDNANIVGTDIASEAIQFAVAEYQDPGLYYAVSDGKHTPFAEQSFDVITCFEVIEHISNPEALLEEAKRITHPQGVFIVSTPNRDVYSRGCERPWNPYHVKEFTLLEFEELLGNYFPCVKIWGQQHVVGSVFFSSEAHGDLETHESLLGDLLLHETFHFLAICSHNPISDLGPTQYWPLEARSWKDQLTTKQRHLEELNIRWRRCVKELQRTSLALQELESLWSTKIHLAMRRYIDLLSNR
jgi:ubiquinone/menaquinone biosynthesis C-methylase UbiE